MDEYPVSVYIYDLTRGLARSMSGPLLGKQLDGVWHTGIVVYGQEFFFGGMGIASCPPGGTIMGVPTKKELLGNTQVPPEMFMEYIQELGNSTFRPESYHLLDHNCNTFSNEVALFLTGNPIPSYITNLPQEVLNTPLGAMLRPFLDAMSVNPSGGTPVAISSPDSHGHSTGGSTAAAAPQAATCQHTPTGGTPNNTHLQAPVKFSDQDKVREACERLGDSLDTRLSAEDQQTLQELKEFVTAANLDWGLSRSHLKIIDTILKDPDSSTEQKGAVARLLQETLCNDDVVAMVTHDPSATYLCVLQLFEQQEEEVQEALAKGLCNCSVSNDGLSWLLESKNIGRSSARNCYLVLSVCRHCLLSTNIELRNTGAALAHSLTRNKVSEELSVDLGCALVELLQKEMGESAAKCAILALCQCIECNPEVAAIAVVSGLDINSLSSRHPSLKGLCNDNLKPCLQTYT